MSSTRSTRATRQTSPSTSEADPTSSSHQSHSDHQPQQNEGQEEEMDQLNSENGDNHQNGQLDPNQGSNQSNHVSTSQPNFQNHNSNSNPAQSATVPSSSSHPTSHQNHHYAPPLGTLEPSAERYHSQAGNGRRGSTDPVLHASIAAAASANVAANGGDKTDKRGLLNNFTYEDPANYYNPNYAPPGPHQYNLYNLQGPPMPHPMMHPQQQQSQLMQQRQQEQQQHQHQHHHHPSNPNPNPPQNGPRPPFQQMGPGTFTTPGIPTEQSYRGEGSGKRKKGPIGAQPGTNNQPNLGRKETPYSRSPDMRVTHASAERKRRSDMKELFDDLRGLLLTDKGPKSSKWEILSKAVDALRSDRKQVENLTAENEQLRTELAAYRGTDNGYATHHQEGIDGAGYQGQDQQDPNTSYPTS